MDVLCRSRCIVVCITWCTVDAVVSELVGIPLTHSEHPQIVRYPKEGGFYKSHMDTSENRLEWNGETAGRSQIEGERVSWRPGGEVL